jgi:nitroimidazol reductase NimA-like FMN-containing flavoprotein (pyridoxamine 5'-phosphate oxidase superfamily)
MPSDVCLTLLMGATVGQVAFIGEGGRQELMPVNFVVVDREIFFRTSSSGPLSALADGRDNVALGVHDVDNASGRGWNVTVRGETERVDESESVEFANASGLGTPWAGGDRRLVVKIVIREIDGRRVSRA